VLNNDKAANGRLRSWAAFTHTASEMCHAIGATRSIRRSHVRRSPSSVYDPLKFAAVERELRFLVAELPDGVVAVTQIVESRLGAAR
jgi:hypothetical protein